MTPNHSDLGINADESLLLYRKDPTEIMVTIHNVTKSVSFWVNGCIAWIGPEMYQGEHDRFFPPPEQRKDLPLP